MLGSAYFLKMVFLSLLLFICLNSKVLVKGGEVIEVFKRNFKCQTYRTSVPDGEFIPGGPFIHGGNDDGGVHGGNNPGAGGGGIHGANDAGGGGIHGWNNPPPIRGIDIFPPNDKEKIKTVLAQGRTYFIVPEFHRDIITTARDIARALLVTFGEGSVNVIFCDWTKIAKNVKLLDMAKEFDEVVEHLAQFFFMLHESQMINLGDSHFIGEGLGAQVLALAGRKLKAKQIMVARITGLDPIGICFDEDYSYKCGGQKLEGISKDDATFVDVLFTGREFWGYCDPQITEDKLSMCHACFYANGGHHQPGCKTNGDSSNLLQACSHTRASELYLESIIDPYAFNASGCLSSELIPCELLLNNFGHHVDEKVEGVFGFATHDLPPFSMDLICWGESASDGAKSTFHDCHTSYTN